MLFLKISYQLPAYTASSLWNQLPVPVYILRSYYQLQYLYQYGKLPLQHNFGPEVMGLRPTEARFSSPTLGSRSRDLWWLSLFLYLVWNFLHLLTSFTKNPAFWPLLEYPPRHCLRTTCCGIDRSGMHQESASLSKMILTSILDAVATSFELR